MTDLMTADPVTGCPQWCVRAGDVEHRRHESAEVLAGLEGRLTAQLVQSDRDAEPQVRVSGSSAAVADLDSLVAGLRLLRDLALPAPAGLGPVDRQIRRAGLTLTEVAEAADLDVSWIRAQRVGRQVLSVHEFERLARAVDELVTAER